MRVPPDVGVAGERFSIEGSPSLAHHLRQAAQDIPHPTDANRTLWDARSDIGPFTGPVDKDVFELYHNTQKELKAASKTGVSPLGSGSDYTVFLQRLGVSNLPSRISSMHIDALHVYRSQAQTKDSRGRWVVQSIITILFGIRRHGWRSMEIQVSLPRKLVQLLDRK